MWPGPTHRGRHSMVTRLAARLRRKALDAGLRLARPPDLSCEIVRGLAASLGQCEARVGPGDGALANQAPETGPEVLSTCCRRRVDDTSDLRSGHDVVEWHLSTHVAEQKQYSALPPRKLGELAVGGDTATGCSWSWARLAARGLVGLAGSRTKPAQLADLGPVRKHRAVLDVELVIDQPNEFISIAQQGRVDRVGGGTRLLLCLAGWH